MKFQLFLKPKRRLTYDEDEIAKVIEIVNQLNGSKDIYRSVYNYDGDISPETAYINKVFLDFDPVEGRDILDDVRKTVRYLKENDYAFSVYFSGRGYHIYIYTLPIYGGGLNSPHDSIRNFVYDLVRKIEAAEGPIEYDSKVIGDLMRVSRLPNTINLKTRLFNIPIAYDEVMEKTSEEIHTLALKQRDAQNFNKGNPVNLSKFDAPVKKHDLRGIDFGLEDDDIIMDVDLDKLPGCVRALLEEGYPGYNERYLIIVAMRDLAYPLGSVISALKRFINKTKFDHSVYTEGQPQYLFSRPDLIFPSCYNIRQRGLCQKCGGQHIYY